MHSASILIIEDEIITSNLLADIFVAEGYDVACANDATQMYNIINNKQIHLVLMDINLPGKNGLTLAREILTQHNIPLIFLTGRDNEIDKILGLEMGAYDYLTKPFNPRELTIKVRNILARTLPNTATTQINVTIYHFNQWQLNVNKQALITATGKIINLSRGEFNIMQLFCQQPQILLSREQLMFAMTGKQLQPHNRSIDVTIRKLRQHFETEQVNFSPIITKHGKGYLFTEPVHCE